jgi:hypothetical protein
MNVARLRFGTATRMTSHRTRYLVELQGYCGLPDPAVAEIDLWLRVAPALCSGWALVATLMQSTTGLAVLAAGRLWRHHVEMSHLSARFDAAIIVGERA